MQTGSGYTGYYVQAVSNKKEAEACSIPMDGSMVVFPDIANGRIYTKQINMNTGAGVFREYIFTETPAEEKPAVAYATVAQLETLSAELSALKKSLGAE